MTLFLHIFLFNQFDNLYNGKNNSVFILGLREGQHCFNNIFHNRQLTEKYLPGGNFDD